MDNHEKIDFVTQMLNDIFQIDLRTFDNRETIEQFCQNNKAIDQQSWLNADAFSFILEKGKKNVISYFEDILNVKIILLYVGDKPVIIGPYLSQAMTIAKCIHLKKMIDNKNINPDDLLVYYGKFPIIPDMQMERIVRGVSHAFDLQDLQEHYTVYKRNTESPEDDKQLAKVSDQNIETHYKIEREYMEAVKRGNIREAIHLKKLLSQNAAGVWERRITNEDHRLGYAINRAMTRIAAYQVGVPAPIIHKITTKEAKSISAAACHKQMESACEAMLKEFCTIIQNMRNEKYSAMVQSIMYSINNSYQDELSIKGMAEELDISESYMISQFKKETGVTPATYLRTVRLKEAASLLISTNDEIQKISGLVGIQDANYFVKLFKAEYQMTPGAYRKRYKI